MRTRGVMISPAVRWPNSTERSISSAVSASRVPWSAERAISEASSVDERADRSSSCGSMPRARTMALAEPLSSLIGQVFTVVKKRMKPCVARAVSIGLAIARFLGTSSPKIIVSVVPRASPMPMASGWTTLVGHAGGFQRRRDQVGDRRLGQEADGQVGDRDADLGPGELGRQRPQRDQHSLGAGVTLGRELLDLGPVDGHERELRRHEHAARGDQQQRDRQQDPRGHRSSRPG